MRAAALALVALCGCTVAPHGSRATHTVKTYQGRPDGLVQVEEWTDRSSGGGGELFTFTKLDNVAVYHTNSTMRVGGYLTVGDAYIGVDTNTAQVVTAIGKATGDVIGAAVGTAAKKAAGLP